MVPIRSLLGLTHIKPNGLYLESYIPLDSQSSSKCQGRSMHRVQWISEYSLIKKGFREFIFMKILR